jgi:hypothetical protein
MPPLRLAFIPVLGLMLAAECNVVTRVHVFWIDHAFFILDSCPIDVSSESNAWVFRTVRG